MSIYSTAPLQLGAVRTYPLASRKSKVNVADFAKPPAANVSISKFMDSLPNFLAAEDLRQLLGAVQRARANKKAILWGIGGHVIKVGLGPILIDLIERGFVSGIAMNGAALIHDFEIAIAGNTSEDVDAGISAGQFGMARETGEQLNEIAKIAARSGRRLWRSCRPILDQQHRESKLRLFQRCGRGLSPPHSGHGSSGHRR